jgi:uncharacterized protein YceH (UPF0502 family)
MAILAELLVRGPQTPGELRTRAARMHPIESLDEVNELLLGLATRDTAIVCELPRQSGRREARYACLWLDVPETPVTVSNHVNDVSMPSDYESRLRALEENLEALTTIVNKLQADR